LRPARGAVIRTGLASFAERIAVSAVDLVLDEDFFSVASSAGPVESEEESIRTAFALVGRRA